MRIPQVTYGAVQSITQGTGEISAPVEEAGRKIALVEQATNIAKEAYVAHGQAETRNRLVDVRAGLSEIEKRRTDNANRMIDPQELRAAGIVVDSDQPVKGSLYAAALYEKEAQALREQARKSVPRMFQDKFDASAEDMQFQGAQNVFNKTKAWERDEGLADLASNQEILEQAGDWQGVRGTLTQGKNEGLLTEQELTKRLHDVDIREAEAPIMAAMAGEKETAIEVEQEKLRDPGYEGPLNEKERLNLIAGLESRRQTLASEFAKVDAENKMKVFGNMEVGISYATGKERAHIPDIERALREERITVPQRNQLTMQYYARSKAEQKANKEVVDVSDALANGVKLSHANADHKKGVNRFSRDNFGTSIEAQKGTPEQRANFERGNIVTATAGIVPEQADAYIVGLNRSNNPEKVVEAANFNARLEEVAPQAVRDIDKKDRIRLQVTHAMAQTGMPAAAAVQYGKEAAERTDEQQNEINLNYSAALKESGTSNAKSLESFMGSNNTFDPFYIPLMDETGKPAASTGPMRAEYETLVKEHFGRTNDLALSRKLAQKGILHTWGRSQINGQDEPVAMKFAPEARTGRAASELRAEVEAQVVKEQVTTLSDSAIYGIPKPVDPKKVFVVSDSRTGKDGRYALQYRRDDGMSEPLYDKDGKQAYWNPAPEAKAKKETEQKEKLEKARTGRAALEKLPAGSLALGGAQ